MGSRNLQTCSGYGQSDANIFYQLGFKNVSFISERDLAMSNNTNFLLFHCVKLAWSAEPILLTSTLLMEAIPGDAGKAG